MESQDQLWTLNVTYVGIGNLERLQFLTLIKIEENTLGYVW